MEVAENNGVNLARLHAGGLEARDDLAVGRPAVVVEAGVNQHELGARVHQKRGERDRQLVSRQEVIGENLLHVLKRRVAHEAGIQRTHALAVMQGGNFDLADLEAEEGGGLRAGDRRLREGRGGYAAQDRGGADKGGTGQGRCGEEGAA